MYPWRVTTTGASERIVSVHGPVSNGEVTWSAQAPLAGARLGEPCNELHERFVLRETDRSLSHEALSARLGGADT
jgi:hypothetical protein